MNFFVARDCNYRDEKFCDVSKADSIARHYILLSKLRSSWRFLKFSEALHLYSNRNFHVRKHVSQKAKGEISNWVAITNRETAMNIQVQVNNTLTADTDDQKFNCDNADGQSQTGNRKKMSGRWIRKTRLREAPRDLVYTPSIEHLFTQTSLYCGFDRYKVMHCIQVPLVN